MHYLISFGEHYTAWAINCEGLIRLCFVLMPLIYHNKRWLINFLQQEPTRTVLSHQHGVFFLTNKTFSHFVHHQCDTVQRYHQIVEWRYRCTDDILVISCAYGDWREFARCFRKFDFIWLEIYAHWYFRNVISEITNIGSGMLSRILQFSTTHIPCAVSGV